MIDFRVLQHRRRSEIELSGSRIEISIMAIIYSVRPMKGNHFSTYVYIWQTCIYLINDGI